MKNYIVHILAVTAMLFWGMSFIWSIMVFESYSPITTIFFRLLISVIFLFPFIFLTGQKEVIRRKDFRYLFLSALFNPFIYFIGENFGLQNVSASLTAVIISTIPVLTPFIVMFFYTERISRLNIIGLALSFIGVMVIIFSDSGKLHGDFIGIMLLFMAVISAIFYTIFVKKLSNSYKPITIIAWQNLLGVFLFLPLFIFFDFKEVIHIIPTSKSLYSLIMLGIFASSAAFIFYTYSIKYLGIIKTNLYTNLIPVFAIIFSFFLLGETLTFLKITGLTIVLFGIILSESSKGKALYPVTKK